MTAPRKGQRVRVTYEAEYEEKYPEGWHQVNAGGSSWLPLVPPHATIELIEDVRPGDVYRMPGGRIAIYTEISPVKRPWLVPDCDEPVHGGDYHLDADIQRPLTLLVRDGRPVTS